MNEKRHILFLCSWYPSKVSPTNGDFIKRHAEAVSLVHNVSVLHIVSDGTVTDSVIETKKTEHIQTFIGYVKFTKNPILKAMRFYTVYKKILKKIPHFDLIHLNVLFPFGIFALHQKYFKKTPFIISEHWTDYKYPLSKKIGFIEKSISKKITKKASFVCPVSKDLQNAMLNFGLQGKYFPVPNVVDTDLFCLSDKVKSPFKLIHVSNMLDTQKNISGILNVIRKLQNKVPQFEFLLIGERSKAYEDSAKKLGIAEKNIRYIDHISHAILIDHLNAASLFILFSNYENSPCVILESFSAGTPVISSNVGGIKECFPPNFGTLVPPNDEKKLLEAILSFYKKESPVACPEMMHSYAVDHFSKKKISSMFNDLYTKSLLLKK